MGSISSNRVRSHRGFIQIDCTVRGEDMDEVCRIVRSVPLTCQYTPKVLSNTSHRLFTRGGPVDLLSPALHILPTLRLDDIVPGSLQWLDTSSQDVIWRRVDNSLQLDPCTECLLIRALKSQTFPLKFAVDMAQGLEAAFIAMSGAATADLPMIFAKLFPQCSSRSLDQFLAAVYVWQGLSAARRTHFVCAGRTAAGSWQAVVTESQSY